ncbi:MAG: pyruvate dehydrogenase complex dihydrolipoamide acetyltransferase [Ferruginibacter sp.]|nr:pyruvate dehydrogenase complex dihydrolipoamide acetyltransferase [Ferruginibacter sp.]
MAEVIRMPRLSDTMAEGKIVGWNKKVGDKVKAGDVLAEVETDKATMELESYNEGTLLYIGVEAGNAAKVDGVLAVVGKEGEDYKAALSAAGAGSSSTENNEDKPAAKTEKPDTVNAKKETVAPAALPEKIVLPAGAKEIRMPLLSDTMTEGKIVAWNKKVGDTVKADDVLAEVETDKATMEVVGYEEGTLLYLGVEAGKAAKINEIIAIVGKPGTDVSAYVAAEKSGGNNAAEVAAPADSSIATAAPEDTKQDTNDKEETIFAVTDSRIKASPLAKKMAEEKGIDISKVNGSGDNGRIIKKDVDGYKEMATESKQQSNSEQASAPVKPAVAVAAFANTGQEGHTDIPLTQMRTVIARRLGESMFSAPHFYLTMELNMDNAITARNAMNEVSPVKISFNDMLIKAVATALRQHPAVNSSWMGDFIRQNHHIHIGSALALPEGLIVPVIKFADQKTLSQIAADAKQLYQKARDKKLQPVEFSGNTFTISNLGMMDIEDFTAIINPPDSCILAVGKIKEIVIRKGTDFDVTSVMKVTMSCDHRSVDGAVGAAFLQTLKKYMENPVLMLV